MYIFKNTEINNKKATDFETKSMLYLLGMRKDSDEIDIITIDCFNDVTGSNRDFTKLWDVQSKNHSSLPPSKIGESLITLFNNHISKIDFFDFILFIPKLNRDYLIDESLHIYSYSNIKENTKVRIEKKLIEKVKCDNHKTEQDIKSFLGKVTFVEDNKRISTYIKNLSKFKNKKSITEEVYNNIFVEIRNIQSSLKNSYIENQRIIQPAEVLKFNRHITKNQIQTLLINRLIGIDVFSFKAIPIPFFPYVKGLDEEEIKDLIQDCNENLSRAFFDKNGSKNFWEISENIIFILESDHNISVENAYKALTNIVQIKTHYLTERTIQYMISLIKTGLENDC